VQRVRAVHALAFLVAPALAVGAAVFALSRSGFERADMAFCNGAEPSSLDPHQISGVPEIRLIRALYEGLVVRDPRTAAPIPGTAESWSTSEDGLAWTFRIRATARWTDGSSVIAQDFVDSWRLLLDPRTGSQYADLLHVVRGARAWAAATGDDGAPALPFETTVGLRAPDERTLVVEFAQPVDHFLEIAVAAPLVPISRRALAAAQARWPATWQVEWTRPAHIVTNGPFRLVERRVGDRIRLARHAGYWDADEVALATLDVLSSEQLGTNLNFYLAGEVAILDEVPAAAIPRLVGREDFRPAPYLATSFLRVNTTRPPLDDARVRRALALSIDRGAITAQVTRGGEVPSSSLVPDVLPGWSGAHRATRGDLAQDAAEARRLLAEAGYGPQNPLSIELHFASQSTNKDVCEVIADGWRRLLHVEARLANQEWKTYLDTQRRLDYDVSRSSWIADYADAANFLDVFAPGAPNSRTGWSDARFGELIERAARTREPERGAVLREAEAILLEAAPVIPLYTFAVTSLVDPRVGGFHPNPLDEHFPKFWYWMDDEELAGKRARDPEGLVRVEARGPRAGLHSPAETRRRAGR
jgi:oligopeptide transport system substrate-binding protein